MALLQSAMTEARKRVSNTPAATQAIRILLLTAGSEGPALESKSSQEYPPHAGALWGLARTARIELGSMVQLVCLDTDAAAASVEVQDSGPTVSQVVAELSLSTVDQEVAYRNGARYVRRLKESSEALRRSKVPSVAAVKAASVALVTGGLGGLGIVTAEALVEMGVQCVVLASRSGRIKHSDQGLQDRLDSLCASEAQVTSFSPYAVVYRVAHRSNLTLYCLPTISGGVDELRRQRRAGIGGDGSARAQDARATRHCGALRWLAVRRPASCPRPRGTATRMGP